MLQKMRGTVDLKSLMPGSETNIDRHQSTVKIGRLNGHNFHAVRKAIAPMKERLRRRKNNLIHWKLLQWLKPIQTTKSRPTLHEQINITN